MPVLEKAANNAGVIQQFRTAGGHVGSRLTFFLRFLFEHFWLIMCLNSLFERYHLTICPKMYYFPGYQNNFPHWWLPVNHLTYQGYPTCRDGGAPPMRPLPPHGGLSPPSTHWSLPYSKMLRTLIDNNLWNNSQLVHILPIFHKIKYKIAVLTSFFTFFC